MPSHSFYTRVLNDYGIDIDQAQRWLSREFGPGWLDKPESELASYLGSVVADRGGFPGPDVDQDPMSKTGWNLESAMRSPVARHRSLAASKPIPESGVPEGWFPYGKRMYPVEVLGASPGYRVGPGGIEVGAPSSEKAIKYWRNAFQQEPLAWFEGLEPPQPMNITAQYSSVPEEMQFTHAVLAMQPHGPEGSGYYDPRHFGRATTVRPRRVRLPQGVGREDLTISEGMEITAEGTVLFPGHEGVRRAQHYESERILHWDVVPRKGGEYNELQMQVERTFPAGAMTPIKTGTKTGNVPEPGLTGAVGAPLVVGLRDPMTAAAVSLGMMSPESQLHAFGRMFEGPLTDEAYEAWVKDVVAPRLEWKTMPRKRYSLRDPVTRELYSRGLLTNIEGSQRLNVNLATQEELASLPGIGTKLATRIIQHREQSGAFNRLSDLTSIPGIASGRLGSLAQHATASPYISAQRRFIGATIPWGVQATPSWLYGDRMFSGEEMDVIKQIHGPQVLEHVENVSEGIRRQYYDVAGAQMANRVPGWDYQATSAADIPWMDIDAAVAAELKGMDIEPGKESPGLRYRLLMEKAGESAGGGIAFPRSGGGQLVMPDPRNVRRWGGVTDSEDQAFGLYRKYGRLLDAFMTQSTHGGELTSDYNAAVRSAGEALADVTSSGPFRRAWRGYPMGSGQVGGRWAADENVPENRYFMNKGLLRKFLEPVAGKGVDIDQLSEDIIAGKTAPPRALAYRWPVTLPEQQLSTTLEFLSFPEWQNITGGTREEYDLLGGSMRVNPIMAPAHGGDLDVDPWTAEAMTKYTGGGAEHLVGLSSPEDIAAMARSHPAEEIQSYIEKLGRVSSKEEAIQMLLEGKKVYSKEEFTRAAVAREENKGAIGVAHNFFNRVLPAALEGASPELRQARAEMESQYMTVQEMESLEGTPGLLTDLYSRMNAGTYGLQRRSGELMNLQGPHGFRRTLFDTVANWQGGKDVSPMTRAVLLGGSTFDDLPGLAQMISKYEQDPTPERLAEMQRFAAADFPEWVQRSELANIMMRRAGAREKRTTWQTKGGTTRSFNPPEWMKGLIEEGKSEAGYLRSLYRRGDYARMPIEEALEFTKRAADTGVLSRAQSARLRHIMTASGAPASTAEQGVGTLAQPTERVKKVLSKYFPEGLDDLDRGAIGAMKQPERPTRQALNDLLSGGASDEEIRQYAQVMGQAGIPVLRGTQGDIFHAYSPASFQHGTPVAQSPVEYSQQRQSWIAQASEAAGVQQAASSAQPRASAAQSVGGSSYWGATTTTFGTSGGTPTGPGSPGGPPKKPPAGGAPFFPTGEAGEPGKGWASWDVDLSGNVSFRSGFEPAPKKLTAEMKATTEAFEKLRPNIESMVKLTGQYTDVEKKRIGTLHDMYGTLRKARGAAVSQALPEADLLGEQVAALGPEGANIELAYQRMRMQELMAPFGPGDGGGSWLSRVGSGIKKLAVGWAPFQMRRAWSMFGGPTFDQYIPAAAQAGAATWQAAQSLGGYMPGVPSGAAGGVMQVQAGKQQAMIDAGNLGYRAWGGLMGVAQGVLPTALSIAGPPVGVGLGGMIGAMALGAGAGPAMVGGAAVAGLGTIAASGMALRSYGDVNAENEVAAATGGKWPVLRAAIGARLRDEVPFFIPSQAAGKRAADTARQLYEEGTETLTNTPIGNLTAARRVPALGEAAKRLIDRGGIWSTYTQEGVMQQISAFAPYAPELQGLTAEELGGGRMPRWITQAVTRGIQPGQASNIAGSLGLGADATRRIMMESTSLPSYQAGRYQSALQQWSAMTRFGISGQGILDMVTPQMATPNTIGGVPGQTLGPAPLQKMSGTELWGFNQLMQGDRRAWSHLGMYGGTFPGTNYQMGTTPGLVTMGPAGMNIGTIAPTPYGLTNRAFRVQYDQAATRLGEAKRTGNFIGGWGANTMWGIQDDMTTEQRRYQSVSFGIQASAAEAQRQYYEKLWPLQDQQRDLQYNQQMGGGGYTGAFNFQQRQMEMSFGYQMAGIGLSRQQLALNREQQQMQQGYQIQDINRQMETAGIQYGRSMIQRGWTQEDWAYQSGRMSREFGWKMEDYEENIRFATGRQRQRLVTQQERDVIRFGEQRSRFDTEKERMEERWSWQDEDHERQMEHLEERKQRVEEMAKMQDKNLELQEQRLDLQEDRTKEQHQLQMEQLEERKKGYQESFDIQKEMTEVTREYQLESIERQKAAAGAAKEHADAMAELENQYRDVQRGQQVLLAEWQRQMIKGLEELLRTLGNDVGAGILAGYREMSDGRDTPIPR